MLMEQLAVLDSQQRNDVSHPAWLWDPPSVFIKWVLGVTLYLHSHVHGMVLKAQE
jgi:hypothetical protein